jgi:hypothetical protein
MFRARSALRCSMVWFVDIGRQSSLDGPERPRVDRPRLKSNNFNADMDTPNANNASQKELTMKKFNTLLLTLLLTGCSMTPENQKIWAEVLNSAADGVNKSNKELRRSMQENNRQNNIYMQPIAPMPVNCFTTYNSLMRAYETRCQ